MPSQPPKKLLIAATVVSAFAGTATASPLRNAAQRPACGNIGQRGQADAGPPPTASPPRAVAPPAVRARRALVTHRASFALPPPVAVAPAGAASRALLRTGPALASAAVARPLLAADERPACSNQIGKGGRSRRCEVAAGVVDHYRADDGGELALQLRTCRDDVRQIGLHADGTVSIDSLVDERHATLRPGDAGLDDPAIARCRSAR